MDITCISDLHGHYPKLEGGDLLIVAGDLTARDTFDQWVDFKKWLYNQSYRKKVVIAGNHDNYFVGLPICPYIFSSYNTESGKQLSFADYLCDSGTEFEGLKIWGTPWTKRFKGMNPHCMAFTCETEGELDSKFCLIPDHIDILITHSPPYGMLDKVKKYNSKGYWDPKKHSHECVGSKSLQMQLFNRISPRLLVFGHIHESYGKAMPGLIDGCEVVNASHVNEEYQPVNDPIRVEL